MRIHIASEDLGNVWENIKDRLVIHANINATSLENLTEKMTETGNTIVLANSEIANSYPNAIYNMLKIMN